jgi:hypothetical protein
MKLEDELRRLFGATRDAPWPGEREAFDRFLRRRARRGRAVAAAAGLALVAVLGAAVLVARGRPEDRGTVAPAVEVVRVPAEGFQLTVPGGWRVQEQLTGPVSEAAVGGARSDVVGVVLVPRSEPPREATITSPPPAATNSGTRRRRRGRSGAPTAGAICCALGPARGRSAGTSSSGRTSAHRRGAGTRAPAGACPPGRGSWW